jgi:Glyoxalase/Bleomycin resistance protein/Dioxygenase superfamily.
MKISHVAIVVKPEDYTNTLEKFRKILRLDFYEKVLEDQKIKVAIFRLENSSIEIITPTEMGSTVDKFLEKRGGGIHHVAIMVDKVDSEVERLKNEGFVFALENMEGAKGKVAFIHPKSTGGVLIELVENEY